MLELHDISSLKYSGTVRAVIIVSLTMFVCMYLCKVYCVCVMLCKLKLS